MANTDPNRPQAGALPSFGTDASFQVPSISVPGGGLQQQAANIFSGLASRLGGWADTAAQDEGARAGKVAGLDPSYRPDDDETIYGRAYRQNAEQSYTNALESNTRQKLGAAYDDYMAQPQSERQPAAFAQTVAKIRSTMLNGDVFPDIQSQWGNSFDSVAQTYQKSARDDFDKRTADQAKASLITNAASAADTAHRVASIPGPDADAQVAAQVDQYNKLIDAQVDADTITAAQAAKMKSDFQQGVMRTRVMTMFENAPDKAGFAKQFGAAYGGGGALSNPSFEDEDADTGTRNNNFGNIGDGKFARSQPGYLGTDGRFAKFATPEAGLSAMDANLRSYAARGLNSVSGIIARWSPPNENDTPGLIKAMAARMGVGPNDRLDMNDPATRSKLIAGLVQQETGKTPYSPAQIQNAISGGHNPTSGLSPDSYDFLQSAMASGLKAQQVQQNAQQRAALTDIGGAQQRVESGDAISEPDWDRLRQAYGASDDPRIKDAFATANTIRTMLTGFRGQTPDAIAAQISGVRASGAAGLAPQQVKIIGAAENYLDGLRKDLKTDPLARAAKEGVSPVPALDFSSPAALASSLQSRAPVAEAAAAHFGLPAPVYLTPDDRARFKSIAAQGGPPMVQAAAALAQTLGPRADAVLKEIGGDAPKFAGLARLQTWGGDPSFIADVAERQRLNNDPGAKGSLELPTPAAADPVFAKTYGTAMSAIPQMNATSRSLAKDAFEVQALRENLDKKLGNSTSVDALTKAAQQAAGATYDGTTQYGGIADYKPGFWQAGQKVLAPQDMRADGLARAIGAISDGDLSALPVPPMRPDGKTAVRASDFQGMSLKSTGHGTYWVSKGDPDGANPQWVLGADGRKFTLDLNALRPAIAARAPDLYRSGS